MQWIKHQHSVLGIICPRDKGKRELFSIHSNTFLEFEVDNEIKPVDKIGNYYFLKDSFIWAEKELLKALKIKPQWIVIDEIGPLELQGKGFDKVIKKLLFNSELPESNLLLVIRENITQDVISNYNLNMWNIEQVDFIRKLS
jgi:nucleoside-triphosphatase THEP1